MRRRFVESRIFSRDRAAMERAGELTLEDLAAVQHEIMENPGAGDVIQGTGGLRKLRLGQPSVRRGKSGGARIVYLDLPDRGVTHLVALFSKRERVDLSADEKRALRELVATLKKETR